MRYFLVSLFLFLGICSQSFAQQLYFPPLNPQLPWKTIEPTSLQWCTEHIPALYEQLEQSNTKGFILLLNGNIVLEKYFGTFTKDSAWYWASAGKTITSLLIGKAQEEKALSILDKSSQYLGKGWTSCPADKEDLITIRNQLTMTSGLDDEKDFYCTLDTCLLYKADAGTRWAYHNSPYTLLDEVLSKATKQNLNILTQTWLKAKTGMTGLWVQSDFNNIFVSTPRSMARFGLLFMNNCVWNGDTILRDQEYYNAMITPSQNLNNSYGYLWWLNGKTSYMLPGLQYVFQGPLAKDAPDDVIVGLGKNGQIVAISKKTGLVMVRMGQAPDSLGFVPNTFLNDIWKKINAIMCSATSVQDITQYDNNVRLAFHDTKLELHGLIDEPYSIDIVDIHGRMIQRVKDIQDISIASLQSGLYLARLSTIHNNVSTVFIKE